MGQSLNKITPAGGEEKKENEIGWVIEECYNKYFADTNDWNLADFYRAVCLTVEEINKKLNSTQFRVPNAHKLNQVYQRHYKVGKEKEMSKEEFEKIMKEVIMEAGFTGFGSKDILIFLYGIPAAALFFKQRIAPNSFPNDVFIPAVTSATVFLLAKLNKI